MATADYAQGGWRMDPVIAVEVRRLYLAAVAEFKRRLRLTRLLIAVLKELGADHSVLQPEEQLLRNVVAAVRRLLVSFRLRQRRILKVYEASLADPL